MKFNIPSFVLVACDHLNKAGYEAWVVGGAIRDLIMGREPKDYDIATSARPDDIERVFDKAGLANLPTGKQYGTITVYVDKIPIEITTFRGKESYNANTVTCTNCGFTFILEEGDDECPCGNRKLRPASRARLVQFGDTIEGDLAYRDFTMNAMAYNPITDELKDPFCGQEAISIKWVQTVGAPRDRFMEDPLRILRAIRFSAQLGFELSTTIDLALSDRKMIYLLSNLSKERIRDEFNKIIVCDNPDFPLYFMREKGILNHIIPELNAGWEMKQCGRHVYDVFTHNIIACAHMPATVELRLAGLLHDIGKPSVMTDDPDSGRHFYQHEYRGEVMIDEIMGRLRYSKDQINYVKKLVRNHMWVYNEDSKLSVARRIIARVGWDDIDALMSLRLADRRASGRKGDGGSIRRLRKALAILKEEASAFGLKDLKVSGYDILELGMKPGPEVGEILHDLLEMVIEDPELNQKEILVEKAKELIKK